METGLADRWIPMDGPNPQEALTEVTERRVLSLLSLAPGAQTFLFCLRKVVYPLSRDSIAGFTSQISLGFRPPAELCGTRRI